MFCCSLRFCKTFALYASYYIPTANQRLKRLKDGQRDCDEFLIARVPVINMFGKKTRTFE